MRIDAFDRLPADLEPQVRRLLETCFQWRPRTPDQLAEHRDRFSSAADAIKHVVVRDDQTVIGFVRVYRRTIRFAGQTVVLGGIGDVCTDPAWRGRGMARLALATAMESLREAGADIAYLCTDLGNPSRLRLYGQFGFVPLGRAHTYVGPSGRRYTDTDGMLAPVHSPAVFERVMRASEPFDVGEGNW